MLLEMKKHNDLNSHPLLWMDKVRHLGNIIDKDCNEVNDCTFKNLSSSDMITN